MNLEISIIVVTWNCAAFIERFVRELEASLQSAGTYEVLLLDNASSDGTADLLENKLPEGFRLVRSSENLGFAGGNNVLLRQAQFKHIALLNPDVFDYPEGFWTKVEAARAREGADVAFVQLSNADGSFQDCVGNFPTPSRALASLLGQRKDWSQVTQPTRVDVGIMAFLLTTKEIFDAVGLIDEDFHMYCEDVEWCWRATRAGKVIVYLPELSLTHIGGASASKRWDDTAKRKVKIQSELLFVRKHYVGCLKAATIVVTWVKFGMNVMVHFFTKNRKAK